MLVSDLWKTTKFHIGQWSDTILLVIMFDNIYISSSVHWLEFLILFGWFYERKRCMIHLILCQKRIKIERHSSSSSRTAVRLPVFYLNGLSSYRPLKFNLRIVKYVKFNYFSCKFRLFLMY